MTSPPDHAEAASFALIREPGDARRPKRDAGAPSAAARSLSASRFEVYAVLMAALYAITAATRAIAPAKADDGRNAASHSKSKTDDSAPD